MSDRLERARRVMPGGVSSPVRAYGAVGGDPRFIERGLGSRVWDADGRELIDLVGSWGPLILGHAHPAVVEAIERAARDGTTFGAPTIAEVELAETVCEALPGVEMVRFVSSGTEAAMSALRLARAATGRDAVLKFGGCYHGHVDALLVSAGSGVETFGLPDSPGVADASTLVARYNDVAGVRAAFDRHGGRIAAVIVEPVAANMGVVAPAAGFLEELRATCDRTGALLIFDEVVTGFRVGRGGAQGMLGVVPDLTLLGKVLGGGMPVGAYGGRADLMQMVAPSGPVYQAGTLAGNPVTMAAGLATVRHLDDDAYRALEERGARLQRMIEDAAKAAAVPLVVQRVGSMLTPFFTDAAVRDLDGARRSDTAGFARFFHGMLRGGVLLPPSQFEAAFVSLAHTDADLEAIGAAAGSAFEEVAAT